MSHLSAMAQNESSGFFVTGKIVNMPEHTMLTLKNLTTGEFMDSSTVVNGQFSFSGYLEDGPEELRIMAHQKEWDKIGLFYTDLLMGNERVSLETDLTAQPQLVTTTGSAIQAERTRYHNEFKRKNHKVALINGQIQKASENEKKKLKEERKALYEAISNWRVEYVLNNFNSYSSLLTFLYYNDDFSIDEIRERFKDIDPILKVSKYGQAIAMRLKYPQPTVGKQYYDIEALNIDQKRTRLSDIKSPFILLQFGANGCGVSHYASLEMKDIKAKYENQISFVTFFVNAQQEDWLNYVNTNDIDWLTLWNEGGHYTNTYHKYHVVGTPTFYLIDTQTKKVIQYWFGYVEGRIENFLSQELK